MSNEGGPLTVPGLQCREVGSSRANNGKVKDTASTHYWIARTVSSELLGFGF